MIEFKQIIGRGTRLFDGKDYFTIYDFVKAHHHFSDPEWDGEPMEPVETGFNPPSPQPPDAGKEPKDDAEPKRQKALIKLADGKERTIQHMMSTTFWHPDGTPMSAQQFMESLYGHLPDLFKSEEELRRIWSAPDTRSRLLAGLAEKGFGQEQLEEMQASTQRRAICLMFSRMWRSPGPQLSARSVLIRRVAQFARSSVPSSRSSWTSCLAST
jgi:type I restriction enzyme R subunit